MATNSVEVVQDSREAGVSYRQEFSGTEVERSAETSQQALAAQQKALIESRFVVAMRMRRSWDRVRVEVNKMCENPDFAAEALYAKPIGQTPDGWEKMSKIERLRAAPANWPRGFSVRFIECALFEMGNVDSDATIIYEDSEQRLTQCRVIDLERNTGYTRTVITKKRVERSNLRYNQEPISVRVNSKGKNVYLVEATADEVNLAEAAGNSKALRTLGERLIRPDLKQEWRSRVEATIRNQAARDPEGERKKIIDGFDKLGVTVEMLEKYLEHPLGQTQPAEIVTLRQLWTALSAGDVTWREVMESKLPDDAPDDQQKPSPVAQKVQEALDKRKQSSATPKAPEAPSDLPPAQPKEPTQPAAAETAPPSATAAAPESGAIREYDDFPVAPFEDGRRIIVKGKGTFVSHEGNWRAEAGGEPAKPTEQPKGRGRQRGGLDFGD